MERRGALSLLTATKDFTSLEDTYWDARIFKVTVWPTADTNMFLVLLFILFLLSFVPPLCRGNKEVSITKKVLNCFKVVQPFIALSLNEQKFNQTDL